MPIPGLRVNPPFVCRSRPVMGAAHLGNDGGSIYEIAAERMGRICVIKVSHMTWSACRGSR